MRNVLLIEDNNETRKVLKSIVKSISHDVNVYEFSDTEGVYDFIFNHTIDLFLVDIILEKNVAGDLSGIRLVEDIRKINRYEFVPVIFVTSLYDPKLYAYTELHSYGYIEKPFDRENVKRVVESALRFPRTVKEDKVLHFRMQGTYYLVKCSEILYLESLNHKIYIYRRDGNEIVIPYKTFEQILKEAEGTSLVQCNRHIIFNKDYLEHVDYSNNCIKLKNIDKVLRIGVTFKQKLKGTLDDL